MQDGSLIPRFGRARRDSSLAVLEGFHALKHALRFGADIELAVTPDQERLAELARALAPDLARQIDELVQPVSHELFEQLAPLPPSTGVIALAPRAPWDLDGALAAPGPLVLLDDPRDLGNLGACVRVAAAVGAGGVISLEGHDPWHPDALRGAAGLHYALPVLRLDGLGSLARTGRELLALDPEGEELDPAQISGRAILAFGSERRGLSDALLARADARVCLPMRDGVSSLNLATSVAATLFAWRLRR